MQFSTWENQKFKAATDWLHMKTEGSLKYSEDLVLKTNYLSGSAVWHTLNPSTREAEDSLVHRSSSRAAKATEKPSLTKENKLRIS